MKITDVRVRKLTEEGKMKCIVSITFDNLFVVHDIKVIEGHNGLFIAMPSRKVGRRKFQRYSSSNKCRNETSFRRCSFTSIS